MPLDRASPSSRTLDAYLQALLSFGDYSRFLGEDVIVTFMGTDRTVRGRAAARQLIDFIHAQAFKTAIKVNTIVCGEAQALVEAEFVGTHIGDFEGVPASHRHVRVPYAVVYDVANRQITALRIYFPLDLLLRQLAGVTEDARQTVSST